MSFPQELEKVVTGYAFNATECEKRCTMAEEEARQHQHTAMNLRNEVDNVNRSLDIERFVARSVESSINSLHQAAEKERKAHAQTKRVTTRKINTLKRKLDEMSK